MSNQIRFRFLKSLEGTQYRALLQLKGQLVSNGFTDVIHILDDGEEYYINSFTANGEHEAAIKFINTFCLKNKLTESITLL